MLVKLDSRRDGSKCSIWVNLDNITYLSEHGDDTCIHFNTTKDGKTAWVIVCYQLDVVAKLLNTESNQKVK